MSYLREIFRSLNALESIVNISLPITEKKQSIKEITGNVLRAHTAMEFAYFSRLVRSPKRNFLRLIISNKRG